MERFGLDVKGRFGLDVKGRFGWKKKMRDLVEKRSRGFGAVGRKWEEFEVGR